MRSFDFGAVCTLAVVFQFVIIPVIGKPKGLSNAEYRRSLTASDRAEREAARIFQKRSTDPENFDWVKKFAAIGDSFTAGIGAGLNYKSSDKKGDLDCSRYSHAYPVLMNEQFTQVEKFEFKACSGARTDGIYAQAASLPLDLDLVTFTAGGNDLCLADLLVACLFLPSISETTCNEYIDVAQTAINTILKDNVKQVLIRLNEKMKPDTGVVVVNSYAEFFNTENENCAIKEDWSLLVMGLPLTKARRIRFNELVTSANAKISQAVDEIKAMNSIDYKVGFANWNEFPKKLKGQFCEPASSGVYPDKYVPNLQFFKPDTRRIYEDIAEYHMGLRKRHLAGLEMTGLEMEKDEDFRRRIYTSSLYVSPNPKIVALHKLDKRAPTPAVCPGDNSFLHGIKWPDWLGKRFHPNKAGHKSISSFALRKAIELRAEVLSVDDDFCERDVPDWECYGADKKKEFSYIHPNGLNGLITAFCTEVYSQEGHKDSFIRERTFYPGTTETHTYKIEMRENDVGFRYVDCVNMFKHVIHNCDTERTINPRNFKFGGRYKKGHLTVTVSVASNSRPALEHHKNGPIGSCTFRNLGNGLWEYRIRGAGWTPYNGHQAMLFMLNSEVQFDRYSDSFEWLRDAKNRDDHMEWEYVFRGRNGTPRHTSYVFSNVYANDALARQYGGSTNGCKSI